MSLFSPYPVDNARGFWFNAGSSLGDEHESAAPRRAGQGGDIVHVRTVDPIELGYFPRLSLDTSSSHDQDSIVHEDVSPHSSDESDFLDSVPRIIPGKRQIDLGEKIQRGALATARDFAATGLASAVRLGLGCALIKIQNRTFSLVALSAFSTLHCGLALWMYTRIGPVARDHNPAARQARHEGERVARALTIALGLLAWTPIPFVLMVERVGKSATAMTAATAFTMQSAGNLMRDSVVYLCKKKLPGTTLEMAEPQITDDHHAVSRYAERSKMMALAVNSFAYMLILQGTGVLDEYERLLWTTPGPPTPAGFPEFDRWLDSTLISLGSYVLAETLDQASGQFFGNLVYYARGIGQYLPLPKPAPDTVATMAATPGMTLSSLASEGEVRLIYQDAPQGLKSALKRTAATASLARSYLPADAPPESDDERRQAELLRAPMVEREIKPLTGKTAIAAEILLNSTVRSVIVYLAATAYWGTLDFLNRVFPGRAMRAAKTAAVQASRSPLGATEARGVLAQAVINHTLNTRPNIESGANLRAGGRAEQRYDPTASISTAGQLLTQPIDRLGNSIGRSNRREFLTATGGNTRLSRHARDARIPNNTVIVHLVRPARHERSASEHSLSDDERDDLA